MTLLAAAAPRASRGMWIPLGVLALSLLGAYVLWSAAVRSASAKMRSYFDFWVRDAQARIEQRMRAYEVVLLGARGLFNASKSVEREEFARYVAVLNLERQFPGSRGSALARRACDRALRARGGGARQGAALRYSNPPPKASASCTLDPLFLKPFPRSEPARFRLRHALRACSATRCGAGAGRGSDRDLGQSDARPGDGAWDARRAF